MGTEAMAEAGEVDIYRDTPLRYLGYANEVGEAFRALMHVRWVRATYGVASAYVLADTYDKGVKQSKEPGADTSKFAMAGIGFSYCPRFHNKPDMLGCRPRSRHSSAW